MMGYFGDIPGRIPDNLYLTTLKIPNREKGIVYIMYGILDHAHRGVGDLPSL